MNQLFKQGSNARLLLDRDRVTVREEKNFHLLVSNLDRNNIFANDISELSLKILTSNQMTNIPDLTPPSGARHKVSHLYEGLEKAPRHVRHESFEELRGQQFVRGVDIMEPIHITINNEHELTIVLYVTCLGNSVLNARLEV